ncbi:MAG: GIY-YIG nuclease family protein [Bacilli bacterium]
MSLNPEQFQELESNGGIYICTYKNDPRYVYIGKTIDFPRRWKEHSTDFLKSKHCGYFGEFFIKNNCSLSDFEWHILDRISPENQIQLSAAERYRINQYDNDGYHILLNSIKYKRR